MPGGKGKNGREGKGRRREEILKQIKNVRLLSSSNLKNKWQAPARMGFRYKEAMHKNDTIQNETSQAMKICIHHAVLLKTGISSSNYGDSTRL